MALDVRGLTPLLSVYDMPISVSFYRDVLGFEVAMNSPPVDEVMFHWCLLRLGSAELILNTEYGFNSERPAQREPAFALRPRRPFARPQTRERADMLACVSVAF